MTRFLAFTFVLFAATLAVGEEPPRSVEWLFSDFDPRQDPLDVKTVREWKKDGITYRYVTFHIGTFKDKPARMAGFYAFSPSDEETAGIAARPRWGPASFSP